MHSKDLLAPMHANHANHANIAKILYNLSKGSFMSLYLSMKDSY